MQEEEEEEEEEGQGTDIDQSLKPFNRAVDSHGFRTGCQED